MMVNRNTNKDTNTKAKNKELLESWTDLKKKKVEEKMKKAREKEERDKAKKAS